MCSLFIKKLQRFFLYLIKTQVPMNSQDEQLSKRRKRQVEIMVNNFPELEVEVSPKAKLNRTESPKSVAEANDHKFVFDSISPHMSPAIEFGEIECSVMPELE